MDLTLVLVLTVVMAVAVVYLLSSSFSSSPSSVAPSSAASSSSPSPCPPSSYSGRPLIDPALQKRWGLSPSEEPQWTVEEVARHSAPTDLWLIIDGRVFDVTDFVEEHPGGFEAIMRRPGADNSEGFNGPQHPEKVQQLIGEYYVGRLKGASGGGAVSAAAAAAALTAAAAVGAAPATAPAPTATRRSRKD